MLRSFTSLRKMSSSASTLASNTASKSNSSANSAVKKAKFGSILYWWNFCSKLPFGSAVFALLIRFTAPYSASVGPRVKELREGYCRAEIYEKFSLKNPFNSIHAVALMNIGELTSGLTVVSALESTNVQGIVTKLETEYFKKAKGTITAISSVDNSILSIQEQESQKVIEVITELFDSKKELVAKSTAWWTLRRKQQKKIE